MKNLFKKISLIICLIISVFIMSACSQRTEIQSNVTDVLTDCRDDLSCAKKVSGIDFPLVLSNYNIKAMPDMIEITYPLDEFKEVTVRKSTKNLNNEIDIDRNYEKYPILDTLTLENGVNLKTRKDKNNIYVAYIAADSGYYSIFCSQGISEKELWQVYSVLEEVEAH